MFFFLLALFLGICVKNMEASMDSIWNETYHTTSDFQYSLGKKLIDQLPITGSDKILDIGCGTGRAAYYCSQRLVSGSVVAIDSSHDMIAFAKKEYSHEAEHLSFICTDAHNLMYQNTFDIAYSFFCLHWIKNQKSILKNIYDSLKPGGNALLCIPCENDLVQQWYKANERAYNSYPELASRHVDSLFFQSIDTWLCWVKQIGFTVVEHFEVNRTKLFKTKEELKEFLLALNLEPGLTSLERNRFLEAVVNELYALYMLSPTQSFPYTTRNVIIKLSKSK